MAVYFRGFRSCECLNDYLPVFERYLLHLGVIKKRIDIAQLKGGYVKSGGTHLDGCVYDIWQNGAATTRASRDGGAPGFRRTRAQGFDPHTHGMLYKGRHYARAKYQLTSSTVGLFHGRNGLASGARDHEYQPKTYRDYRQGIAWMEAQMRPKFKPQTWYVHVASIQGHTRPLSSSPKLKVSGKVYYGRKLRIIETKQVGTALWGRTGLNRWWPLSAGRAGRTAPKPKPVLTPVGFTEVTTYNVCSTSYRRAEWHEWRARKAVAHLGGLDTDVALLQEGGSGKELATLDTELRLSREAGESLLVRVNGGEHWRHILRDRGETKFVTTTVFKLRPSVDKDGNQAVAVVLKQHGVLAGYVTFHLDVTASTAEKVAQTESLLKQAEAWFAKQGVHKLNRTYGGDKNDSTGKVTAVYARYGYARAAELADKAINADRKTNNGFGDTPRLAAGAEPIDDLYVDSDVDVTDYINLVDHTTDQAADHNPVSIIRALYRVS